MSEAIKPTPGEWEAWTGVAKFGITGPAAAASMVATNAIKQSGFGHFVDLASSSQECPGIALGDTKERAVANANLFAEAGSVHNTTGLTPRQLVDRVKELEEALTCAQQAINSMKVEAETAAQGDEQMMLEACQTISNEGLQADMDIRRALDGTSRQPTPQVDGEWIDDEGRIKWLLWRVKDLELQRDAALSKSLPNTVAEVKE